MTKSEPSGELNTTDVLKLLYGDGAARRFTQDSPVLPDVWMAYLKEPEKPQDLLLTPFVAPSLEPNTPGKLAHRLTHLLGDRKRARSPSFRAERKGTHAIAYNQATVAVRLWFDELVRIILPLSAWWNSHVNKEGATLDLQGLNHARNREAIAHVLAEPVAGQSKSVGEQSVAPDLLWTVRVAGITALVNQTSARKRAQFWPPPDKRSNLRAREAYYLKVVETLAALLEGAASQDREAPLVYMVSLNRKARVSLWKSTAAIKSDAAKNLFKISCRHITWAIVDSGIDASHPAFFRRMGAESSAAAEPHWSERTRIMATYDFSTIRSILSPDPEERKNLPRSVKARLNANPDLQRNLRNRLQMGHDIDWNFLLPLIRIPHNDPNHPYRPPVNEHGTHVAGILAADWLGGRDDNPAAFDIQGVCPDINLYDLRVLNDNGEGDEFSVMAALQFIRHLNAHQDFMVLHGVNVSLSIPHEVRNYACGRTPVCDECERLSGAGIVVVAAAGNEGYPMTEGGAERFQGISITDPGNADAVITVGSTHRDAPHTYGVSYFSSRGPTGDGRIKPDLVAPGEKIESTVPGRGLKRMDGTSQAAPHVSGSAALIMARHTELVGRPSRIRQILCETATNLGRERYFQGHGLVDALRAIQSI
jgi:serine protease AprX